jgi:hypothetical protein
MKQENNCTITKCKNKDGSSKENRDNNIRNTTRKSTLVDDDFIEQYKEKESTGSIAGPILFFVGLFFLGIGFCECWYPLFLCVFHWGLLRYGYGSIKTKSLAKWSLAYSIVTIIIFGIATPIYWTADTLDGLWIGFAFICSIGMTFNTMVKLRLFK